MDKINTRLLVSDDSKAFYKVRLSALELFPEAFGTGADSFRNATDEQVKDVLTKNTQNDFTVGAFFNKELIGVVSFKREPKASVNHKATVWGFFVKPDFQNKGVGKSLLEKLIALSKQISDIDYLRAIVTVSDINAGHVFSSVGFIEYGLEKNGIKQGLRYFDQSFMQLNLKDKK